MVYENIKMKITLGYKDKKGNFVIEEYERDKNRKVSNRKIKIISKKIKIPLDF